jgi:nitrite reductase/ring-hydroxylating ferredoxin subunit
MHTAEENETLTRSGPGTPVGNLLRRYWTPACLTLEIAEPETSVRVRLLGEDLVAFRDTEGEVGLIDEHCPHRGASLFYGRNEECGLRCIYHGWKFDRTGQCVDMPVERRSFAEQIKTTAYPTHESGGIVWTHMGPPETMTPFRDFGTESLLPDEVSTTKEFLDCNWMQSLDGDLDGAHISYLHSWKAIEEIPDDGTDRPGYPSSWMSARLWAYDRAPRLEVEDAWHGFRYAALRDTPNGYVHARTYAYVMPYGALISNIPFNTRQLMIVPIDDEHAWRYTVVTQASHDFSDLTGPSYLNSPNYPYVLHPLKNGIIERSYTRENNYQYDRDAQRSATYSGVSEFRSQDLLVTESMGPRYDRTKEHWGTTDAALIRMHALLLQGAKDVAEGKDPLALADGVHDFKSIRAAEKILSAGEDWRELGTDDDEMVRRGLIGEQVAP